MQRFIHLRIGLLSVLASFVLLSVLLAFAGTASAHMATNGQVTLPLRPQLSAQFLSRAGRSLFCIAVRVSGQSFRPGKVHVIAFAGARSLSVQSGAFSTRTGSFARQVVICRPTLIIPRSIVVWAVGPFGGVTNRVSLFVPTW